MVSNATNVHGLTYPWLIRPILPGVTSLPIQSVGSFLERMLIRPACGEKLAVKLGRGPKTAYRNELPVKLLEGR